MLLLSIDFIFQDIFDMQTGSTEDTPTRALGKGAKTVKGTYHVSQIVDNSKIEIRVSSWCNG